jgi:SAM-dependent methyltransferase
MLEAIHSGFWLGIFRLGALHKVTAQFYADHALYCDPGHNLGGLFSWEQAVVDVRFAPGALVLVPACGGGRELAALAARGFRTTGFDPDRRYLDSASAIDWKGVAHVPVILHAPPDRLPGQLPVHDACLLGWGAYTHIVGRPARIAFLQALGQALVPGAPLLLSFWVCAPRSRKRMLAHAVASFVATLTFNSRRPEYGDWLGQNFTHSFHEREIRDELAAAGFELEEYGEQPYGHAVARRC